MFLRPMLDAVEIVTRFNFAYLVSDVCSQFLCLYGFTSTLPEHAAGVNQCRDAECWSYLVILIIALLYDVTAKLLFVLTAGSTFCSSFSNCILYYHQLQCDLSSICTLQIQLQFIVLSLSLPLSVYSPASLIISTV